MHAKELAELIDAGGYIFVCGDGAHMAKDVNAALQSAIKEHGELSEEDAVKRMASLVQEKRYIRDVWS